VHDLVIRGGVVVDGTGDPARLADVAIEADRIRAVGRDLGRGRREIDAAGHLVTPGWVDVHTHYDGQATWDPYLSPSSWHGVTTVVMGNCGVGFAPVSADRRAWIIDLMEGVEAIPGPVLTEGVRWSWESFPDYLDALASTRRVLDVAAQVPHGPLRAHVLADAARLNQPATPEQVARMAVLVREAIAAGAIGFSTSRTLLHYSSDGNLVPGTTAPADELLAIGRAMQDGGGGVVQLTSDFLSVDQEFAWMTRLARETGNPVVFVLSQNPMNPKAWRTQLALSHRAVADGAPVFPQVAGRPTGLLAGLQTGLHPFARKPSYRAVAHLPLAERVARMREPALRERILAEPAEPAPAPDGTSRRPRGAPSPLLDLLSSSYARCFALGDPPDYEPPPERSVKATAEREQRREIEVVYDILLERGGRELLYLPLFNYLDFDFEAMREMLLDPHASLGFSDAGAHCAFMCDASMPTYMLTYWARDRRRGPRLPIELVVKRQTHDTAQLYRLVDRGVIAPGAKADINVIDFERLALAAPEAAFDLPAGGMRLVQRATGYRATIVSGAVVSENGQPTGAMPGALVRRR
jgi:N-acyl-D-aspartate/D-glutamate deacylase